MFPAPQITICFFRPSVQPLLTEQAQETFDVVSQEARVPATPESNGSPPLFQHRQTKRTSLYSLSFSASSSSESAPSAI